MKKDYNFNYSTEYYHATQNLYVTIPMDTITKAFRKDKLKELKEDIWYEIIKTYAKYH